MWVGGQIRASVIEVLWLRASTWWSKIAVALLVNGGEVVVRGAERVLRGKGG